MSFRLWFRWIKPRGAEPGFEQHIRNLTGLRPIQLDWYRQALRHSSVADAQHPSNERLEFLGDSVLSMVVADYLFRKFPVKDEGYLTEVRSKMVSRNQMTNIALKMGIDQLLEFNKADVYLSKNAISGNALEAVIGAIYLDRGKDSAHWFIVHKLIQPFLDIEEIEITEFNYKSKLLEWGQKNATQITFRLLEESRMQRNTLFKMVVMVNREEYGFGQDYSKKNAEKKAAKEAFLKLGLSENAHT